MMHTVHDPESDAILFDGCPECEERSADVVSALAHMDNTTFKRAWERAGRLQMHGLRNGQGAEVNVLRFLAQVQIRLEALGISRIGELPGSSGDRLALDGITNILSGNEWTAGTLEEVAVLVRMTGRQVNDL